MIVLALDTTSESGSLAVRQDGKTLAQIDLPSPDGSAHLIFPAIEETLKLVKVSLERIDCFAAAGGPGSFTGVRVGLSVVKGLAEATGKRVAAISNLRALSWFGCGPLRAVFIDARRGDVYAAVYDDHQRAVLEEVVLPQAAWFEKYGNQAAYEVVARGTHRLATAVAYCAEFDGPTAWRDPLAVDANYVRQSDPQMFWKDRVKTGTE